MRQVGGGEVVVVATSSFQEDLPQTLISALVVAAGGRVGRHPECCVEEQRRKTGIQP